MFEAISSKESALLIGAILIAIGELVIHLYEGRQMNRDGTSNVSTTLKVFGSGLLVFILVLYVVFRV